MKVVYAVALLVGAIVAGPAIGYSLREPVKAPDGSTLTDTNRLLACVHSVEGQYPDWLRPTSPRGGGTVDLTAYRPKQFPKTVKAGCVFCLTSGCPVWGPADGGSWSPTGTFIPSP